MASGIRRNGFRHLHALATLIHIQPRKWESRNVLSRRRLQRRRLIQQIIYSQNELEWIRRPESAEWFWRVLRWGGPGLLLGMILEKLSS